MESTGADERASRGRLILSVSAFMHFALGEEARRESPTTSFWLTAAYYLHALRSASGDTGFHCL
jgi:hypothetical protein